MPRTKKGEKILWKEDQIEKVSEREAKGGFWGEQRVSTNSSAVID